MSTDSIESGTQAGPGIGRPRLLQRVHEAIRVRHYSRRTEEAYVHWIRSLIYFHGKCHPRDLSAPYVEEFLTQLAVEGRMSATTQNQAKVELLFHYGPLIEVE